VRDVAVVDAPAQDAPIGTAPVAKMVRPRVIAVPEEPHVAVPAAAAVPTRDDPLADPAARCLVLTRLV
jgi:hypothetical protein